MKCQNISFKGYSNVIANNICGDEGAKISILAMQLDDIGQKDLSEFKHIKQLQGLMQDEVDNNVLLILRAKMGSNDTLWLGKNRLYNGDELKIIEETLPKYMSKDKYEWQKRFHMKAYTKLAEITKRLMNENRTNLDNSHLKDIVIKLDTVLGKIIKDEKQTYNIILDSILKGCPFQKVAGEINRQISKSMQLFFK